VHGHDFFLNLPTNDFSGIEGILVKNRSINCYVPMVC
jgi:hypothetical protein